MLLKDYIAEHFEGNQSAFAKHCDVKAQQVTVWLKKGFIVVDGVLFSPRREIK